MTALPAQFLPQVLIVGYAAGCAASWAYLTLAWAWERHNDPAWSRMAAAHLARRGTSAAQEIAALALLWPLLLRIVTAAEYDRQTHHAHAGAERAPARKAHHDR